MDNDQRKELTDIICEQTIDLFKVMFGVDVKPYINADTVFDDDDLVSKVVLTEGQTEIVLRFVFPRHILEMLLKDLYGPIMAAHESTREDAICEISNIVCAGLKKHLNEKGHALEMNIPCIDISYNRDEEFNKNCLRIDFFIQEESFSVDLKMEETS